jgi:hypothetical protein
MDALAGLGFARALELGELMSYQACLTREVGGSRQRRLHARPALEDQQLGAVVAAVQL